MVECARTHRHACKLTIRISATDETIMQQCATRTRRKTSLKIQLLMKVFAVSWHTKIQTHTHTHSLCVTTYHIDFGTAVLNTHCIVHNFHGFYYYYFHFFAALNTEASSKFGFFARHYYECILHFVTSESHLRRKTVSNSNYMHACMHACIF